MTTIPVIKTYPDKTPVDAVQAKLSSVYEYRKVNGKMGPTTVQNVELEDGSGQKIRVSVWGHPDMTDCKGKEYIFHQSKQGKGLTVAHGSYTSKTTGELVKTVELTMSGSGGMQFVEVYKASNPAAVGHSPANGHSAPVKLTNSPQVAGNGHPAVSKVFVNGAKVGMAINNATLVLAHSGLLAKLTPDQIIGTLKDVALDIMELSDQIESGEVTYKSEPNEKQPETAAKQEAKPAAEENEEDVPY